MPAAKINAFGGMIPAIDDRLLPDQQAAFAENVWLYSGAAIGLRSPSYICDLTAGTQMVYRIPNNYTDSIHLSDAVFMEFANIDTVVLRAPIVGDTYDRYYWSVPGSAPRYNTAARIRSSSASYLLGIPTPVTAPTVTPSGGSAVNVTRAYVYTWVSTFGEEGPPSPPTTATGRQDGTWALGLTAPTGSDTTDRTLATVRIYRTITSSAGVASYFFVAEQSIATTTYSDTKTDTVVAGQGKLESTNWTAPPSDLQGWVSMPNGMIVGWRENELWFSEPYRPHAWPASYAQAVEYSIVGLGVTNQTVVICTAGYPLAATGNHPDAMTLAKLASLEPCTSRGSIVSTLEGVYYSSPNGLVLASNGVVSNVSSAGMTRDQWLKYVPTSTLRAARVGQAYYAWGSSRPGVFDTAFKTDAFAQEDFTGAYHGIMADLQDRRVSLTTLRGEDPVAAVLQDPWTNELLLIRGDKLYWLDFTEDEPEYEAYIWRTKVYQTNKKENVGAIRVYFTVPSTTPTQATTRNTDAVQELAGDQYGLIRAFADGALVMTRELRTSGELMRLPSGFKSEFWQFEIEARVQLLSFQFAPTPKELASV